MYCLANRPYVMLGHNCKFSKACDFFLDRTLHPHSNLEKYLGNACDETGLIAKLVCADSEYSIRFRGTNMKCQDYPSFYNQ